LALPVRYVNRVRPQDLDGMLPMAGGDEWRELSILLIASLAMTQAPVVAVALLDGPTVLL
jgi:hypothetical protein